MAEKMKYFLNKLVDFQNLYNSTESTYENALADIIIYDSLNSAAVFLELIKNKN